MKFIWTIIVSLMVASSASAQEESHPTLFHAAIAAGMALQGGDAMQTAYLIGSSKGHEANPILAPFSNRPFVFGATKLGIASVISWFLIKEHKNHRWLTVGVLAGELAVESFAVVHNNKLIPPR